MVYLFSRIYGAIEAESNERDDSPESLITPYEDINTKQEKITGERFPSIVLELCDNCRWCAMCFNTRGLIVKCPICGTENSQIPMNINEVCHMESSHIRGVTLSFNRKNPMR
jgi:ribosomal protein S27E